MPKSLILWVFLDCLTIEMTKSPSFAPESPLETHFFLLLICQVASQSCQMRYLGLGRMVFLNAFPTMVLLFLKAVRREIFIPGVRPGE